MRPKMRWNRNHRIGCNEDRVFVRGTGVVCTEAQHSPPRNVVISASINMTTITKTTGLTKDRDYYIPNKNNAFACNSRNLCKFASLND